MKFYKLYDLSKGCYIKTFETKNDMIRFLAYHQRLNEWYGNYRKGLEGQLGYYNHYLDNINLTFNDTIRVYDGPSEFKYFIRPYVFIDPDDRIIDPREYIDEIINFYKANQSIKREYNAYYYYKYVKCLPEFREGPVPGTGKRHQHRGSYYRIPKTIRDKRTNCIEEHKEFIRGKRSNKHLPDPWDEYTRSDRRSKSWKDQSKKKHQWEK